MAASAGLYAQERRSNRAVLMNSSQDRDTEAGLPGVTERAARRVAQILAGEPPGAMFRVAVNGGGCSGFQYSFELERVRAPDDLAIEREGAVVLIDPVSLTFLKGARIDFVDDLIGRSFKVDNPNATASCGCGVSFSV